MFYTSIGLDRIIMISIISLLLNLYSFQTFQPIFNNFTTPCFLLNASTIHYPAHLFLSLFLTIIQTITPLFLTLRITPLPASIITCSTITCPFNKLCIIILITYLLHCIPPFHHLTLGPLMIVSIVFNYV